MTSINSNIANMNIYQNTAKNSLEKTQDKTTSVDTLAKSSSEENTTTTIYNPLGSEYEPGRCNIPAGKIIKIGAKIGKFGLKYGLGGWVGAGFIAGETLIRHYCYGQSWGSSLKDAIL